jgi:hypothetical protein
VAGYGPGYHWRSVAGKEGALRSRSVDALSKVRLQ